MWSYKFSQLKGSSDDGRTKLTLVFQSDQPEPEKRVSYKFKYNIKTLSCL